MKNLQNTPTRFATPSFGQGAVSSTIAAIQQQGRTELLGQRQLPADLGKQHRTFVQMADGSLCEQGAHRSFDDEHYF